MDTTRIAQYEHKCNKCGALIRAYRDCTGETHSKCTEIINGRPFGGQVVLTRKFDYEVAKAKELYAEFN